jgi:hypothetical protein
MGGRTGGGAETGRPELDGSLIDCFGIVKRRAVDRQTGMGVGLCAAGTRAAGGLTDEWVHARKPTSEHVRGTGDTLDAF